MEICREGTGTNGGLYLCQFLACIVSFSFSKGLALGELSNSTQGLFQLHLQLISKQKFKVENSNQENEKVSHTAYKKVFLMNAFDSKLVFGMQKNWKTSTS